MEKVKIDYSEEFNKVYENTFLNPWKMESKNVIDLKKIAEKNRFDKYVTTIELLDTGIQYVTEAAKIESLHTDRLKITLLHNGEDYKDFTQNIQPQIEFQLKVEILNDGVETVRLYNLKYLKCVYRYVDCSRLYLMDIQDKANSLLVTTQKKTDQDKLAYFMNLVFLNNYYYYENESDNQMTKNEKIEAAFSELFQKRRDALYQVTPSYNVLAERCDITVNDKSITLYDIPIQYLDENGNVCSKKTDKMCFTLLYKGEPVKNLNCVLHPKKDYGVELFYEADGKEYRYIFNLKYLEFTKQESYGSNAHSFYIIDGENKQKSIKMTLTSDLDINILRVFFYLILVNNFFDEKTNERKNRLNPPLVSNSESIISKYFGSSNNVPILSTPSTPSVSHANSGNGNDPYKELDDLIGLDSIKKDIKQLADFVKVQQQRKQMGLPKVPVSLHLVFTGNPGTGKTTIARILAKIYKDIGVLSTGQLVEADRSSLVAEYVGQTAVKTQGKIREAMGGVLFIDEAYTLYKGESKDFGQEAIDTILKAMEDNRDKFVVIVAGYPDLMKKFIESNPGLQSRFNKYINFPDYSENEMLEIFDVMCEKYEYRIDDEARERLKEIIHDIEINKDSNFANARTVRNIFETVITKQATRVVNEKVEKEEMTTIKASDFE